MINILFLTYGALPFPPEKGGAIETLLQTLVDENEQNKDCQFTIISRETEKKDYSFKQTRVVTTVVSDDLATRSIRWGKRFFGKVFSVLSRKKVQFDLYPEISHTAKQVLTEESFDIVVDLNRVERISKLRPYCKGKYVLYFHNDYLNKETYHGKQIYEKADGIFSVCDFLNDQVKAIPQLTLDSNLYRVNNGIKLENYLPTIASEKQVRRKQLGIPENDFVIAFSGRVTPTKGVDILLKALQKIDREDMTVLIIGGTTYSSENVDTYTRSLHKMAKELKANVIFTGYLSNVEVPNWVSVADVCAVPSIFHETCCLSAVEAQAMGIPVVATAIGGIPEYISKESAYLINYDEQMVNNFATALEELYENKGMREKMAEVAIQHRNRHSAKRYYDEFLEAIQSIG